jgi:hypothetical protein
LPAGQAETLCSPLHAWSSINLKPSFIFFETTSKEPERESLGRDEVLPCYRFYLNALARRQFTLVYRGYDLDVTRAASGWSVGVHPKSADLPIIGRSEVFADDQDQAVIEAKVRIDGALSLLACAI